MLERPPDLTDGEILEVVRSHWEPRATAVVHLPVGWGRTWLIDWESWLLAPRERDLATLVHGRDVDHDPSMVRLFDLEWRLSEIWSFAQWLQGPHSGHTDDRIALGGLTTELTRSHFDER